MAVTASRWVHVHPAEFAGAADPRFRSGQLALGIDPRGGRTGPVMPLPTRAGVLGMARTTQVGAGPGRNAVVVMRPPRSGAGRWRVWQQQGSRFLEALGLDGPDHQLGALQGPRWRQAGVDARSWS